MLGQIHFDDHTGFQRNTVYWTVAGAAGGLLGFLSRTFVDVGGDYFYVLMTAAIGLALGAAAGLQKGKPRVIAIGLGLGGALGAAAGLLAGVAALAPYAALLGAAVAGIGTGLFWGSDNAPRPARAVGYALAAVVGLYVVTKLVLTTTPVLDAFGLPGVQDVVAGGALGFFLSLGGTVGRLRLDRDPVKDLWYEAREELDGDMAELAGQGVALHDEIIERIESRQKDGKDLTILDDARRISTETTQRLIRLSRRWCQIEKSVDDTTGPRLTARRKALEAKLASSKDSVLKAEYTAIIKTLDEQLEGFDKIDIARERLVARMHRCLASLERVSLKVLQLSTSDAQDASLSLQPELDRLDDMSDELSWKALSVDDLCSMELEGEPATLEAAIDSAAEASEAPIEAPAEGTSLALVESPAESAEEKATVEAPAEAPAEAV